MAVPASPTCTEYRDPRSLAQESGPRRSATIDGDRFTFALPGIGTAAQSSFTVVALR